MSEAQPTADIVGSGGPIDGDRIADSLEAAEVAGGFGLDDAVRALWRTARHTPGAGRRAGGLAVEAGKVAAGRSAITPSKGDWRFKDETWRSNPAYRRLMQAYLAWSETLMTAVGEADVDWRDAGEGSLPDGVARLGCLTDQLSRR